MFAQAVPVRRIPMSDFARNVAERQTFDGFFDSFDYTSHSIKAVEIVLTQSERLELYMSNLRSDFKLFRLRRIGEYLVIPKSS
jgi:hypothetical protein